LVRRCLITTADERTWPVNKPVVFLGEWCKRFSRKNFWEKIDSTTVPYHWDNRIQFGKDYDFLKDFHEDLLTELSSQLNNIHEVNHTVRYWRILVGPWLGIFVQILFDRWKMLKVASEQFNIDSCYVRKSSIEDLVPNDMQAFIKVFVTDTWNEAIYAQLLDLSFDDINIHILNDVEHEYITINNKLPWKARFSNAIYTCLDVINKPLAHFDDIFILNSCFSKVTDAKIQWNFIQFPKMWHSITTTKVKINIESRKWKLKENNESEFARIARKMIPLHIPAIYLEGYKSLVENQKKLPWPKNPKVIFTSTSFASDDVFKAWAAGKVENKSSLVIGQHGGNFGMTPRAFLEYHQIEICDFYFSWGWSNNENPKVLPIGSLKNIGHISGYSAQGNALMVEYALPRYSYQLYSVPIASQWIDYFEDQCRFVTALPVSLQDELQVRLYKHDHGWDQEARWKHSFPNINFDLNNKPIKEIISKSRVYISTYNATTYLESLSWNFPTIIFWNPNHWEINDNALYYFNLLESVGIFHRTPESAAQQLIKVWDNVLDWWEDSSTQQARIAFCKQYSHISDDSIHKIQSIFSGIKN
jgi:putative transferase (TIGR04331 family)